MARFAAVTLGKALLHQGHHHRAIDILEQVSHNGPATNTALPLLVEAYLSSGFKRKAIGQLNTLLGTPIPNESVARMLVKLPLLLEEVDALGEAIKANDQVKDRIGKALMRIQDARHTLENPEWINGLLTTHGAQMLSAGDLLRIPAASFIVTNLASHRVHAALDNALALKGMLRQGTPGTMEEIRQLSIDQGQTLFALLDAPLLRIQNDLQIQRNTLEFNAARLLDKQAVEAR